MKLKGTLALFLALMLCLSLCACGDAKKSAETPHTDLSAPPEPAAAEAADVPESNESEKAEEAEKTEETEPEVKDAEMIPNELQGVWGDTELEGLLTLYAFRGDQIETYVVNSGLGAASVLSGTYTVENDKISYDFGNSTGYSGFTYEQGALELTNANGAEIRELSAADIMEYLTQEENAANHKGVVCLADLILNDYPDSAESSAAAEKKDAAKAAIKAAGEAALQNLNTSYDQVQKLTWYQHKNQPQYADICCYVYPYIGRTDDGYTWLRVALNYTDAQTDAGWIFFNKVIFSVDGENTTKTFSRSEILRDNDTEVWEVADFEPNASEVQLLKRIADSAQTIVRFQGDQYEDHIVTDEEKTAIKDVLTAYAYLTDDAE